MDEGYILSNKYRRIIFEGLVSGEKDINFISKKHRIAPIITKKILDDLIKNKIIEKKGNIYQLTKEGEKLASIISG
jgi:predicted transcriptional regulator